MTCSHCAHTCATEEPQFPNAFERLLRSNDLPLQSEAQLIHDMLPSLEEEIQHEEEFIQCLETHKARLDRLTTLRDTCQTVFSPIRRLPRDIIGEIFCHALTEAGMLVELNTKVPPWTYSQVCRLWRDEILSRKSFWTRLRLDSDDLPEHIPKLHLINTILSRSGDHDLDVRLDIDDSAASMQLLDTVIQHSYRWKAFSLTVVVPSTVLWQESNVGAPLDRSDCFDALKQVSGRIPRLQSLSLGLQIGGLEAGCIEFEPLIPFPSCFSAAPALKHVCLDGFDLQSPDFNGKTLTHFQDKTDRDNDLTHEAYLLTQLPNLLHYDVKALPPPPENHQTQILHKSLRSISVETYFTDDPGRSLLSILCLPALTTVDIYDISLLSELKDMIDRSQCTITTMGLHLSLVPTPSRVDSFINLLQGLSSITRLESRYYCVELLQALTRDSTICPNLKIIKVLVCWGREAAIGSISSLLKSRQKIKTLIVVRKYMTAEVETQLETLRAECSASGISFQDDPEWC